MARVASSVAAPVTRLLDAWGQGDQQALEQLTPIVYKELRRLAQWHMNGERPNVAPNAGSRTDALIATTVRKKIVLPPPAFGRRMPT